MLLCKLRGKLHGLPGFFQHNQLAVTTCHCVWHTCWWPPGMGMYLMSKCFSLFRKTLWAFLQKWAVVNIGCFDDKKYSFFEAVAGGTAIACCSYKYQVDSNSFLSFCKSCVFRQLVIIHVIYLGKINKSSCSLKSR